jgi:hypothetical protein
MRVAERLAEESKELEKAGDSNVKKTVCMVRRADEEGGASG